jgi:hypothetical protein
VTARLDLSDERYRGRPLLALLDHYAYAMIGNLSPEQDARVAATVRRVLGNTGPWTDVVRRKAGLPDDMDSRIRTLWAGQPPGTDPGVFVRKVSDANFLPLVDPVA